jgi:hypothetical protein
MHFVRYKHFLSPPPEVVNVFTGKINLLTFEYLFLGYKASRLVYMCNNVSEKKNLLLCVHGTIETTFINNGKHYDFPTRCIYVLHTVITINICSSKQHLTVIFVRET